MSTNSTIVIIGGGAAGYFAAINAAENHQHAKVILLEKTGKTLQKVKVSGGGRCNVTHHCFEIIALSKNYPRGEREMLQAFHQFAVKDLSNVTVPLYSLVSKFSFWKVIRYT